MFWHTPNGGKRSAAEAARFKAMGVLAGIPDLMLISGGRVYGLEIKTSTGRLSKDQRQLLADLEAAGATVATAHGIDEALAILGRWGMFATSRHPETSHVVQ